MKKYQSSYRDKVILMVYFLLFIGLPVGYFTVANGVEKIRSASWPTVTGEIVRASIYERTGRTHDWCLKLDYRYTVDGKQYRRHYLTLPTTSSGACHRERAVVESWLPDLAPGTRIVVHHAPDDPSNAVLAIVGLDLLNYLPGGLLLIFGAIVVDLVRTRRRERAVL